ncbi:hypothetical protein AAA799P11_01093 [Marine Group I thaumarchaeote SCGC AAA799-P11]|uniref:Uncharacterized protein n=2 Tax=Marine Group I TaxID=905826 RepID=A0A087RY26_9ARCH|nr:hypothetical protein AAA799D11_00567 [Marine Group I thaumarchaeote SCGC AAA799-D11]KFM18380.1 hypothetical protein AAA799P11_01093 [Marine Group I thaumarchaeote SCGC AAA799-P11]
MSVDVNSQSFKEEMIAEIKRIQNELNELKNLKVNISKKSTARKPAKKTTKRKTAAKKKTVKRKPAKKTTKRKTRRVSKSKKKTRRR